MGIVDDFKLSFYEEVSIISERNNDAGSEVYLVKDTRDDRLYVKKILKISEENVYQTIMNYEMKYPNRGRLVGIPKIYAIVKQEKSLVVVEEYINHPTLRKVMESEAISPQELITIFKEICRTMQPLHTLHPPIIHRDIKPDNIMVNMDAIRGLSSETKVYVIDWNAAREYSYSKERDTQLMGTIEYAAPEQLGYGQSDVRTDIFGVGATLEYCMRELEGKSVSVNYGHIWSKLNAMTKKAKSLSPEDRYSSDLHMIEAFDEILDIRKTGVTESARDYTQASFRDKRDYILPGFRTRKLWKMIVAVLGYIMIIDIVRDTKLNDYRGVFLIYSKVSYFILLICHVFWFSNYLGVQDNFKWTRSGNRKLKVLGHVMVIFVMWMIWAIINSIPGMLGLI